MTFDIRRSLTNAHGEIDEDAAEPLEAELMERFAESPEASPIIERTGAVGWAGSVLSCGRTYEGVTVTTMGKRELSRVLLDVFPRKVSCELQRRPLGDPLSGAIVTRRQAWWCSKRGGILIHRWGRTHAWHGACCFTPTDSAKVDLAKAPRDARPLPRATRNAPPFGRHTFVLLRAPAPGVASSRS